MNWQPTRTSTRESSSGQRRLGVSKDVGERVVKKTGENILENATLAKAKKLNKLGKLAKVIDESPTLAAGKEAAGLANDFAAALEEYPELAKQLGIRLKEIRSEVYSK